MIILTTSAQAQTLSIIPRQYDDSAFTMSIRDDSTNVTKLYQNLSGTTVGNYMTFNNVFNPVLVEAHFLTYIYTLIMIFGTLIIVSGIYMMFYGM